MDWYLGPLRSRNVTGRFEALNEIFNYHRIFWIYPWKKIDRIYGQNMVNVMMKKHIFFYFCVIVELLINICLIF